MRRISSRDRDLPYTISGEEPFRTYGSLSGTVGATESGILPQPWRDLYEASREAGTVRYTVQSYNTPIAWTTVDGYLFVPGVKYSTTTSKHQGKLFALINRYWAKVIRTPDDLIAPPEESRPDVSPHSGEGAIYSPEYLRRKSAAMS